MDYKYLIKLYLIILSFWFIPVSLANTFSSPDTYSSPDRYQAERHRFHLAKKALAEGRYVEYQRLKKKLKHYPLYPYLEYAEVASRLSYSQRKRIRQFLNTYDNEPVSDRLYARWLDYLIRGDRWQAYLQDYDGSSSTKRQCYHALAQYRAGNIEAAYNAGIALWNVGKSQPDACDTLFGLLIGKGQVTEAIAWQRFQKAYTTRNTKLLRYLERFFTSSDYKKAYRKAMEMRSHPSRVARYADLKDDSPLNRDVISYVLARFARKAPIQAERQWLRLNTQLTFDEQQIARVQTALIKALVDNEQFKQADGLLQQWQHAPSDLIEWRTRQALEQQDWPSVRYLIQRMPTKEQETQRWRYWFARAETALTPGAQLSEHPLLPNLANERGYYSFLAADELQKPYALNYEATKSDPDIVSRINNDAGLLRARELFLVGETTHAIREWREATRGFTAEEWEATGAAFHQWGWPYISIICMTKAQAWQDIVVRFPVLHEEQYRNQAKQHQLDTELLLAITRQESAFHENAVSPSNARGLMQLLPSTAKYIAGRKQISYKSSGELMQAEKNIALGSAYYRYLMDKFGNNRAVSIASYNAGPGRVNQWLKQSDGNLPIDIWIETIPFNETRRYVQNVLSFSVIYARKLGKPSPLFTPDEKVAQL